MTESNVTPVPFEHRFHVPTAVDSVAQVARADPDTPIVLTVARVTGTGGIEEEREVKMRAEEAAALLVMVGTDQKVPGVSPALASRELYILRVSRPTS